MDVPLLLNQAKAHHAAGRMRDAEPLYRQILAHDPAHAEATHLLGLLAAQCGHLVAGIELMEKSARLNPDIFYFHNNLGETYKRAGRFADAAAAFARSDELRPGDPQTLHSRAVALERAGQLDDATQALGDIIARFPDFPRAPMSLGAILESQARYDEALDLFERAVALDPDYPKARAARAAAWLRAGDYARGWDEYEWRWRVENFPGRKPRPDVAMWEGQDLEGRRILVYAEQGFGDTIQFVRYAPLLAQRGATVIVEAFAPLVRLLRTVAAVQSVVTPDEPPPAHDLQVPMLSLPRLFHTSVDTIPSQVPYLTPPSSRPAFDATGFKVGLCWMGNQAQPRRSIPFELIQQLIDSAPPACRFVSLQKDRPPDQPLPASLADPMPQVADFADTAAIVGQLDLVITIDTAVAHLAGALAKPTWLLLPRHADWRWLEGRDDSPWYPTMRLFRQAARGHWPEVLTRVAAALRDLQRNVNSIPT
jgi:Flp pilus assembly protein TadD